MQIGNHTIQEEELKITGEIKVNSKSYQKGVIRATEVGKISDIAFVGE